MSNYGRPAGERRDVRLTLDVSLSPDSITGTLSAEDGAATPFESWLGLARAVASAAGAPGGPLVPSVLLADDARPASADSRESDQVDL